MKFNYTRPRIDRTFIVHSLHGDFIVLRAGCKCACQEKRGKVKMLFHKHAYLKIRHSSSLFPQNYPPHVTEILKLCYTRLFFPCFSKKFIPLGLREAPQKNSYLWDCEKLPQLCGTPAQNGGRLPQLCGTPAKRREAPTTLWNVPAKRREAPTRFRKPAQNGGKVPQLFRAFPQN